MRKRPSGSRLNDPGHGGFAAARSGSPWRADRDALPMWQVLLLLAAAVGALYVVLSYTNPRARTGRMSVGHQQPTCYPISDEEAAMVLGRENKAYNRRIATRSSRAQTLFNMGMLAAHGFNQVEAAAWFMAALRSDPECVMCYWGLAYTQGPMPNKPPGKLGDKSPSFQPTHATDALNFITTAARLSSAAMQAGVLDQQLLLREHRLVQALAERYAAGAAALKGNRWPQQEAAYAEKLKQLAEESQGDADLYALAAEAFMNLTPWEYYTASGDLKPSAATAERLIEAALVHNPRHTHALHLHIHISEAGTPGTLPAPLPGGGAPQPAPASAARGLASADMLTQVAPNNGHLLHMPSHTFVRVGQYKKAVEVNEAAYAFDVERGKQCVVPYFPEHNLNMLVYAASMAGMFDTAARYARGMRGLRQRVPDTWMAKGTEWVSLPLLLIRYGRWEEILQMQAPPKDARGVSAYGGPQFARVVYRAARTLALAAKAQAAAKVLLHLDDVTAFDLARKSLSLREKEVVQEHKQLKAALRSVPVEPPTRPGPPPGIYAAAYTTVAAILERLVDARLALLHNNTAVAVDVLTEAVALEDGLGYMEPPRVHQPLRQCLGWALLLAKRLKDSAETYKQDLLHNPANGWSQLGLQMVAEMTGDGASEEVDQQRALAEELWRDAEASIDSSCPALSQRYDGQHE